MPTSARDPMENLTHATVSESRSVAPRTPTEQVLLEIWSAILNVDTIGVHDDFLDLGGDSLSATRCINRIRTAFAVDVPLEAFFAARVDIAALAPEIDRLRRERTDAEDLSTDRR